MFGWDAIWTRRKQDRLGKLAEAIETAAGRDRALLAETERISMLRRKGASDLHALCSDFADALNQRLSLPLVVLDPPGYDSLRFDDNRANLFQFNLRGRLLQIEFEATEELSSTENYRTPYILEGAIRAFNQELLDHNIVDEKTIFYCPTGPETGQWQCFDGRTHRTIPLSQEFLIAELERIV